MNGGVVKGPVGLAGGSWLRSGLDCLQKQSGQSRYETLQGFCLVSTVAWTCPYLLAYLR